MPDYQKRLYQILYPNHALVASQLGPDEFARHYQIGSNRYYLGKLIFAEVDASFRNPFFDIDGAFADLVPHKDGRPKATKFIASYRVIEHIDLKAVGDLFIATSEGPSLRLKRDANDPSSSGQKQRIFSEICPLRMLVLTKYSSREFAAYITRPGNPKGAPKIFFTQVDINPEEFVEEFRKNPFLSLPVPSMHPSKLKECVEALQSSPDYKLKGLSLHTSMGQMSFKLVKHGFWMASETETIFFRMPSLREIETENLKFFKSM